MLEPVRLNKFTFHYVSIKSDVRSFKWDYRTNLHSTMYLLNLSYYVVKVPYKEIYIPLCIY